MGKTTPSTSNAALQLHCATPKSLKDRSRGEQPKGEDVRASRYRLLDEQEQAREAREIERIQRTLEQQRRPRQRPTTNTKATGRVSHRGSPKRTYYDKDDAPPPYDSVSWSKTSWSSNGRTPASRRHEPTSPQWSEVGDDELINDSEDEDAGSRRVAPLPSSSSDFQRHILQELQKLKQAQQKDLVAIQKLQREKEDAERKANALEQTLRQQMPRGQSRPPKLVFGDMGGDESAPPPLLTTPVSDNGPSSHSDREEDERDHTDGERSPCDSPDDWMTPLQKTSFETSHMNIQYCNSPVFTKRTTGQRRPSSARSVSSQHHLSTGERVDQRPRSARAATDEETEDDGSETQSERKYRTQSRGRFAPGSRIGGRSVSRARSRSREDLCRSSAFFEQKFKAQEEEEERQREAQRRLERAARATPPANLLKRQEEAQRKKREQLQKIQKERDAELSPAKRARARDVPPTTYVPVDSFATAEEREQARKERVLKRSQDLMAQAELPSRMQLAQQQDEANAKAMEAAAAAARSTRMAASLAMSMTVSVKARRKLQEQLDEEERRRQLMRPKPVPNFTYLQNQWEKALSVKKSKLKPTETKSFFSTRESEFEALRAKKEARKRKMAEQEEQSRRREQGKQRELLERTRKAQVNRADGPKLTKSDALRMKKTQEAIREQRHKEEQERLEQERRELRLKEASRRVTAQVKHGEIKRKGDYAGDFVELTSVESMAKEKVKKQREQFREAVQRNKERLLAAVATKPSLMERFAIDLKREEHKKNALEAVVKHVFQKNFKDMKGILTEEEEELAHDLIAADEADEDDQKKIAQDGGTANRNREENEEGEDEDHEMND